MIGTTCYYWEHKPSLWLELGIVIYLPEYWSGGYGTKALSQMMEQVFTHLPIPRVGITTWSGNVRMMKLAEKVGMKLEGRMRNCRIVDGKFYDSIPMGMLREEWIDMKESNGLW